MVVFGIAGGGFFWLELRVIELRVIKLCVISCVVEVRLALITGATVG